LGNKITKIREQNLQKFQKYGNKNLGTKIPKISRNKSKKKKETKSRNETFKNPGTKISKIWEQ
jgi:hypothetical protein